jgi:hypothetical protein
MELLKTPIDQLLVLKPSIYSDERGYFFESYNQKLFFDLGLQYTFVQDNQSKSKKGVIRGLHFQIPPYAQTKLVRVVQGEILDIALDLRKNSPTYGKLWAFRLAGSPSVSGFKSALPSRVTAWSLKELPRSLFNSLHHSGFLLCGLSSYALTRNIGND